MKLHCPMCHAEKEVESDFPTRPFCSIRCKNIDLANWIDQKYTLPRELTADELADLPDEQRDLFLAAALGEDFKPKLH